MKKYLLGLSALFYTFASVADAPNECVLFSPYQQMSSNMNGNEPQDLVKVSQQTGIRSFNLAFIKDNGVCDPIWSGNNSVASGWGQQLMANMRKSGIQYNISFGGADPRDLSNKCSVSQLISIYQNIINIYQPSGLDFDIETSSVNVSKVITALKTITINNPNLKISFTLPVMPGGLGSLGKQVISEATKANLNYVVNIMVMDYGAAYTGDMAVYAMQAATNTFNYLKTIYPQKSAAEIWQSIALTPMIGVNDIPGELFTLANTDTLNRFAQEHGIAWLSMWSLGRDRPCSDTKANSKCSGANAQSKIYEFSQHMLYCSKTPPTNDCLPPTNIKSKVSSNKKAITLSWDAPQNSQPIVNYQVNNYKDVFLWKGTSLTFTDNTLPGKNGTYGYVLYSQCASGLSKGIRYSVIIK
ncbi:chitinase domain protein [Legionella busanensis]|uniref:Chitinase domain protein n=1 Tax=Legionella busanensis TaxID=190655 RepID=A0A378JP45_9GAMM|nr:glycosyl hydrolase family 18 protein [Legionella busanensis]STX52481.1 chitinase domain protein [Legionella busanensis]